MRNSLKNRILRYLKRQGDFINGARLEELAMENGFKGSTASRIARSLAEEGLIQREERKGNRVRSVWYRAVQPVKKIIYHTPYGQEVIKYEY